jgi:hypothetical protein
VEDRLAKSLRAAHERHAQHLSALHASHDQAADHSHSQDHAPSEHHQPAHHGAVVPAAVPHSTIHADATHHPSATHHHPAFAHGHATAAAPSTPVVPSAPAPPQVHLVAAEHHTHSTVPNHPIPASVVVPPVHHHAEVAHHVQHAAAPASPPAPSVTARTEPSRLLVSAGAAVRNRFSQQGKVSIVGTVVLSVLISAGLFSLQTISKWRRPKPTETVTKADSIDQPLTIASAQDESQTPNERADAPADSSPAVAANESHTAQSASHSEDNDQHGLDEFFANGKKEVASHAVAQTTSSRAPYAPEPVDSSVASQRPADTRTVMAPEAAGNHGLPAIEQPVLPAAGQPDALPAVPSSPALSTAQNVAVESGPQISPIYRPSSLPSPAPSARPLDSANGSPSSQQLASGSTPGVNVADWNRSASAAAPGAPASAVPVSATPDAMHSRLDAPGPVIMPGRTPGSESTAASGPTPSVVPAAATSDPASQLGDLSQQASAIPSQAPPGALPSAPALPGVDPVTGLIHRTAATPDVAHPEFSTALASLDRTKVMSFQFRNAPWTVVLSQFAAETHLELRMQAVPQGVFNRWDAARYSPSQTLAILNSEIARAGCQLKLEGNVLRVTSLSSATAQNTSARAAAAASMSLLPQSSGIVPVSGRY